MRRSSWARRVRGRRRKAVRSFIMDGGGIDDLTCKENQEV
jgi:hypothetical protein